jgi:hypothetical protein
MCTTAKFEGEGPYAGLASRLRTKEDVKKVMIGLAKGIKYKELSLRQVEQVQNFYAGELYGYTKDSKVKEALAEYIIFADYLI